jgi:hypothetical protein
MDAGEAVEGGREKRKGNPKWTRMNTENSAIFAGFA